jgi:tRNA nucleotidyltransferase (CCA-adding enzyme)
VEVFGVEADTLHIFLQKTFPNIKIEYFPKFSVWKIHTAPLPLSVSLPRADRQNGPAHTAVTVVIDPYISKKKSTARRDFTINSLLLDPLRGRLFDPTGGARDLQKHILRAVDLRTVGDDPLRPWRAIQFIGRFNLTISAPTKHALQQSVKKIGSMPPLSGPRIAEELHKLFRNAQDPLPALQHARNWSLLATYLPELKYALMSKGVWEKYCREIKQAKSTDERWLAFLKSAGQNSRLLGKRLGVPKRVYKLLEQQ